MRCMLHNQVLTKKRSPPGLIPHGDGVAAPASAAPVLSRPTASNTGSLRATTPQNTMTVNAMVTLSPESAPKGGRPFSWAHSRLFLATLMGGYVVIMINVSYRQGSPVCSIIACIYC